MNRHILYIIGVISSFFLSEAIQARTPGPLSDSLEISLLTCSQGPDAYERFGHTGIRVHDLKTGRDLVFHYGVFSFNTPNFIYRFVKGETDYQLGLVPMSAFLYEYDTRGLGMTERVLWLSKPQKQRLAELLYENYRPENRTYRYNYFFDNCATRPFYKIEEATDGLIRYDSTWVKPVTHRMLLKEKTGENTWLDFGISLTVAGRADRPTTMREQIFLPEILERCYENAMIDLPTGKMQDSLGEARIVLTRPLVKEKNTLLEMKPEVYEEIHEHNILLSPLAVSFFVLLCAVLLTWGQSRSRTREQENAAMTYAEYEQMKVRPVHNTRYHGAWDWGVQIFDTLLLLASGLGGIIVWFLNFFSEHPAVSENWNCWWLLPTNLIFALLIWLKIPQKLCKSYFFIIFAALIVYLLASILAEQRPHTAFIPLVWAMSVRYWFRAKDKQI